MDIRSAEISDSEAVIALWQRCGLTRPWNEPAADFAAALANPTSDVLLIADADAPIASVMVGAVKVLRRIQVPPNVCCMRPAISHQRIHQICPSVLSCALG
ncbi:hypothetical protein [uncultured Parasphingopyxis sp.]|uniref:hypothetical protein n=1 Tax=uncultured Parasphingopyxis sp. TaxID=1547918 RepID=UPI002615BAD5|nr:hypothetical protein [uncultured Parasphingopyxis sp.]